ncbi:heme biosynthesis HemY N-terminal domain-containing protein [Marinimicrobium sp. ARAG 43.8]|uniref:heme biosynthesis HemY N-terminal domain-containing protein n=1 Tax=Marinimicrobium sp. ARAG 43.8 TaxID=3418719 RepID=UPI003CEB063C
MKRTLIILFIAMLLGALTLSAIQADSGYVLIALGNTSVEMSFWMAVLLLFGTLGILWLVTRLLRGGVRAGRRVSRQLFSGTSARAQRRTASGLVAFIEGNWKQSQRKLVRSAPKSGTPLINYLAAARCAYEQGDNNTALELLHKAEQSSPQNELAVALTQARMQLMSRRYEQCLATLERVKRKAPQHPVVLDLLRQVYIALQDWDALKALMPSLRAYGNLSESALDELAGQLHRALLEQAGQRAGQLSRERARDILSQTWKEVPSHLRKQPETAVLYARQLEANQLHDDAGLLIQKTLEKQWSAELVRLYGILRTSDTQQQLIAAESWLKKRPADAMLMLTLGRLSLRNQLWGKAREYFQHSLKLQQNPETCAELARLLAHLGEHKQSTEYYQQGLLLTTDRLPDLPQPREQERHAPGNH